MSAYSGFREIEWGTECATSWWTLMFRTCLCDPQFIFWHFKIIFIDVQSEGSTSFFYSNEENHEICNSLSYPRHYVMAGTCRRIMLKVSIHWCNKLSAVMLTQEVEEGKLLHLILNKRDSTLLYLYLQHWEAFLAQ